MVDELINKTDTHFYEYKDKGGWEKNQDKIKHVAKLPSEINTLSDKLPEKCNYGLNLEVTQLFT